LARWFSLFNARCRCASVKLSGQDAPRGSSEELAADVTRKTTTYKLPSVGQAAAAAAPSSLPACDRRQAGSSGGVQTLRRDTAGKLRRCVEVANGDFSCRNFGAVLLRKAIFPR